VASVEHSNTTGRVFQVKDSARFAIVAVVLLAPSAASPHFVLLEPTNMLVQNELGDPQKLAPCGPRGLSRVVVSGSGGSWSREFTAKATR